MENQSGSKWVDNPKVEACPICVRGLVRVENLVNLDNESVSMYHPGSSILTCNCLSPLWLSEARVLDS